jgi:retron-type reverse transcriptase
MRSERVLAQLADWTVPKPLRTLVGRWLDAGVWNAPQRGVVAGTSQGGVISPLLCNVYLHPFDCALDGDGALHRDLWLVRYADDFVILARDERAVRRAATRAAAELRALDLELHPQKTRITTFNEGFQFVGWFFVREEMFELK